MAAARCIPGQSLQKTFTCSQSHSSIFSRCAAPLNCGTSRVDASPFSTTIRCCSRVGKTPLAIPPEVKLAVVSGFSKGQATSSVEVTGPKGTLRLPLEPYMTLEGDKRTQTLRITDSNQRRQREMWGTTRNTLQNHILGVSEGHIAILRLVGVGYRATIENSAVTKKPEFPSQKFVSLKVGYSHPIELGIPPDITASTPHPTRLLLEGINKERVIQFAAEIRAWRKPEPYKGKGIFVNDETIKLKSKKIK